MYSDFKKINALLGEFFKLFTSYICYSCDKSFENDPLLDAVYFENFSRFHHEGKINSYLKASRDITGRIDHFFNDIEHGLFHGLMTAFVSFFYSRDSEQDFCSCLLHDFLKDEEGHDKKLRDYFPKLVVGTYSHTNPKLKNVLILCDRVELRRYTDYESWVDNRFKEISFPALLDIFYDYLRPSLEFLYKNRNDIWIRHGFETTKISQRFPFGYEVVAGGYAIEHDRFPFEGCSNHSPDMLWNRMQGFIPLSEFRGRFIDSKSRDHLYAYSNLDIDKWMFVYRQPEDEVILDYGNDNEKAVPMKNSIGMIETLLNANLRVISLENVQLFGRLVKLISDRFTLLNYDKK